MNLICIAICWFAASFDYYLISYELKYIKGDIFTNGLVSSISELFAYMLSGQLVKFMQIPTILRMSFSLSAIGMILLIVVPT